MPATRLLKLATFDQQKTVLADLVAACLVVRVHGLAGDGIDQLAFEAMTRAAVHLPEGDPFRSGRGGIERDRTGFKRKLEKAVPVSTRQRNTPTQQRSKANLGDDSRESMENVSSCFAGAFALRSAPHGHLASGRPTGVSDRG